MSRPKAHINESRHELRTLVRQHEESPLRDRIRMLDLLRENPTRSLPEVAAQLGRSERSVQRWWNIYRESGLDALLQTGHRGKPRKISDSTLEELRLQLLSGGFSELKDIREWLETNHGLRYSQSGAWYLMRSALNVAPGWIMLSDDMSPAPMHRSAIAEPADGISDRMITFLNSLPTSDDVMEWGSIFRESLRALLGDIDRISINVNVTCDLQNPESYEVRQRITRYVAGENALGNSIIVASDNRANTPSARLIEDLRRQGHSFDAYHPPHTADYYYSGSAYLGTIFLWREISNPATREETVRNFTKLEPFIVFALSDLVARHQSAHPVGSVYSDALEQMVSEADLTATEHRIVSLHLMGHAYKEIAGILSISLDTVKKHFHQIYRKTGTRGQAELFAKYFTSRVSLETDQD